MISEIALTHPTHEELVCSALYNTLRERDDFDEIMKVLECSEFERFVKKIESIVLIGRKD